MTSSEIHENQKEAVDTSIASFFADNQSVRVDHTLMDNE